MMQVYDKELRRMQNEYDLQNIENFKINPQVWLQTLLAIAGDKEKKKQVIQTMAEQSDVSPETAEIIFARTINVLINDTRSN
jgi:hypothetical protein